MSLLASLVKPFVNLALAFLLMQGAVGGPPQSIEEEFNETTTPPTYFLQFNEDFSTMNSDRIAPWINSSLGLVKDGVLFTRDEAIEVFNEEFFGSSNDLIEINLHYNYGEISGANTFQTDCWVDIKLRENGADTWYRFHNQFVFMAIDTHWYLIQSEFIPAEAGVTLEYESFLDDATDAPVWAENVRSDFSGTQQPGSVTWPLLIGNNFAGQDELHPIEGVTPAGGLWNLEYAVASGKPVVFYFFTVHNLSLTDPEELDDQMDFLNGLYDQFGYQDLYIFGVTDDSVENVQWVLDGDEYSFLALLLDKGSLLHANLNIDVEPYIVVFDHHGTVTVVSKTWHPSSLSLINDRITEAVEAAKVQT